MNSKKLFAIAKEEGITSLLLKTRKTTQLSISLFEGQIDNYSISTTGNTEARGIYNDKLGFCKTEQNDNKAIYYLINGVKETASLIDSDEKSILFDKSEKYTKKNVYNKALNEVSIEKILSTLHEIEDKLKACDPKVSKVTVEFNRTDDLTKLENSSGLNLTEKSNSFMIYATLVMVKGEETKADGDYILGNDFSIIDVDKFVENLKTKVASTFDPTPIKNGKYKAVLDQSVVDPLIDAVISNFSSESIQKHSSIIEGKLGEEFFSPKLTVLETPLKKNIFFTYFDGQGVATQNKSLIEKGVVKTYLYNLENAKKDNTESTGNGDYNGSKPSVTYYSLSIKPGKSTFNELLEKIGDGVYITSVTGLHAGLNSSSGDFSLQASGFHVENGKIASPLTLITVGGNIFKLFKDVIAVGNDLKLNYSSNEVPSIAVKNLIVSA